MGAAGRFDIESGSRLRRVPFLYAHDAAALLAAIFDIWRCPHAALMHAAISLPGRTAMISLLTSKPSGRTISFGRSRPMTSLVAIICHFRRLGRAAAEGYCRRLLLPMIDSFLMISRARHVATDLKRRRRRQIITSSPHTRPTRRPSPIATSACKEVIEGELDASHISALIFSIGRRWLPIL